MSVRYITATGDLEFSTPELARDIAAMRDDGHPWHTHKITGKLGVCDALNLRSAIQCRKIMREHGVAEGRIEESYDRFERWPTGERKGMHGRKRKR
jgi:hypothetical protein